VGRSCGRLSTKIHARVDRQGRPIQLLITPGQAHDLTGAEPLLAGIDRGAVIIADKAYDAIASEPSSKRAALSPTFPT
jgi:IS5 family transposase